jgi:preprotein translocase subunit SecE
MARTRQKAKQRQAKRRAEQQQERTAQGTTGQKPPSNPAEQAVVEQAEAYEVGDAIEESGGDAEAALERIETEESDEAVKPVREARGTEPRTAAPERPAKQAARPPTERRDRRAREARPERRREPRQRGRIVSFLVQVWAELRRVQWPDRTAVTQATGVVVVFCLLAGLYLAMWDWVFSNLVKAIL